MAARWMVFGVAAAVAGRFSSRTEWAEDFPSRPTPEEERAGAGPRETCFAELSARADPVCAEALSFSLWAAADLDVRAVAGAPRVGAAACRAAPRPEGLISLAARARSCLGAVIETLLPELRPAAEIGAALSLCAASVVRWICLPV